MCGRMTLTTKGYEQLVALLDVEPIPDDLEAYRPRYNIAPTDDHWMVWLAGDKKKLRRAKWGFRPGGRELLINIRGETAKKRFKTMFEKRRCLIPADGFYEWKGPKDDRRPVWFHPAKGELLLFAGLYDEDPERPHFTVLTTDANPLVAPVHDRMPVILSPEKAREWLESPSDEVLRPAPPEALVATEVSPKVNSVKNDDPSCLEPPPAPKHEDQLKLF